MRMKKLLYLIPVILIILCATPFALYKDTVTMGSSLDTASPRYWNVSVHVSFSGTLNDSDTAQSAPKPSAYSDGATFKGFPIGAYFSRSSSSNSSSSSSSFSVSGWSWLWGLFDILLIAGSLYLAIRVNKRRK